MGRSVRGPRTPMFRAAISGVAPPCVLPSGNVAILSRGSVPGGHNSGEVTALPLLCEAASTMVDRVADSVTATLVDLPSAPDWTAACTAFAADTPALV